MKRQFPYDDKLFSIIGQLFWWRHLPQIFITVNNKKKKEKKMVFSFSKYLSEKSRPTLASLGIMEANSGPPCRTSYQHSTIVLSGLRASMPFIGSSLCREPQVSRTAAVKNLGCNFYSLDIWYFNCHML